MMEHSVCPPPLEACPKSGGCARSCGGSWETASAGLRQLRPYCLHGARAPAPPRGARTGRPQSCAAGSRKQSLGYPGTWQWKQRKWRLGSAHGWEKPGAPPRAPLPAVPVLERSFLVRPGNKNQTRAFRIMWRHSKNPWCLTLSASGNSLLYPSLMQSLSPTPSSHRKWLQDLQWTFSWANNTLMPMLAWIHLQKNMLHWFYFPALLQTPFSLRENSFNIEHLLDWKSVSISSFGHDLFYTTPGN